MAAEKNFEKRVKNYLNSVGVYGAGTPKQKMNSPPIGWYVKVWGGGYQKSGIPDMILCVNGIFISVELKASNGIPSELQKLNTREINQTNGIGIILYPNGFDDFKEIIREVISCKYHIQELKHIKDVHTSSSCVMLTS